MKNINEEKKLRVEFECSSQLSICIVDLIKEYIADNGNIINDTNIHMIIIFAFAKSISIFASFLLDEEKNKETIKEYLQFIFDTANELVIKATKITGASENNKDITILTRI